jgi:hypothetical protein
LYLLDWLMLVIFTLTYFINSKVITYIHQLPIIQYAKWHPFQLKKLC